MTALNIDDGFRYRGQRELVAPMFYAAMFDCVGDWLRAARILWHPLDTQQATELGDEGFRMTSHARDLRCRALTMYCPDETGGNAGNVLSSAAFWREYSEPPFNEDEGLWAAYQAAADISIILARQIIESMISISRAEMKAKKYGFLEHNFNQLRRAWKAAENARLHSPSIDRSLFFPGCPEKALHHAKRRALYGECAGLAAMQKEIEAHSPIASAEEKKKAVESSGKLIAGFCAETGIQEAAMRDIIATSRSQSWSSIRDDCTKKQAEMARQICGPLQRDGVIISAIENALNSGKIRMFGISTPYRQERYFTETCVASLIGNFSLCAAAEYVPEKM